MTMDDIKRQALVDITGVEEQSIEIIWMRIEKILVDRVEFLTQTQDLI